MSKTRQVSDECRLAKLLRSIKSFAREFIFANIIAIIATFLMAMIPLFIPFLVDELLLGKSHGIKEWLRAHIYSFDTYSLVFFTLIVTLMMRFIATLLSIWQSKIFITISKEISRQLQHKILSYLKRVSLKAFETMQSGAIVSKVTHDVKTIDEFISVAVSKFILALLIILFSAFVLLNIHLQLGLFILITNPLVILLTAKMARKVSYFKRLENKAIEELSVELTQTIDAIEQIRAFNKEGFFFGNILKKVKDLKARAIDFAFKSDAASKSSSLIFLSGYEIFRSIAILVVATGDLSVGMMLAVFSYLWVMVAPTQDIISFVYAYSNAKAACDRINEIFALESEPIRYQECNPFDSDKPVSIEVKNLNFGYNKELKILKNISLSIKGDAHVAITGASGSGKSTLAKVLVGFYGIDSGNIFYNECHFEKIGLSTIRSHAHLVVQHPKLFNDTMRFNLTLGASWGDEEILRAVRMAQLEEVIASLPNGLDTPIGRDGVRLSGGQKQRVAIARMILVDPKIVIFDESTSALDLQTEAKLYRALAPFLRDKTVVTIAHRVTTLSYADYIYVMGEGRIIEEGSFEALQKKEQGIFAPLKAG